MTVYVTIGNSDDKLSQRKWSKFYDDIDYLVEAHSQVVFGRWASLPTARHQNACWAFEVDHEADRVTLRNRVRQVAGRYGQDSIAWAETEPEFLTPADEHERAEVR